MQNMEHLPAHYCYQNVTHNFRPQNSECSWSSRLHTTCILCMLHTVPAHHVFIF